jgi:probable rRNA maturation factor
MLVFLGKPGPWEGEIILVNRREMEALNRRFRKRNHPTTVLSFPGSGFCAGAERYLGLIVLCFSEIRRREGSRRDGRAQLIFYLAHGILHCIGYDHARPADRRRMELRERRIMSHFFHTV